MITIKIKELEKKLDKKIIRNIKVLGVDTASRTGWAKATVDDKEVKIDYGFIDIESKDKLVKFNFMIEAFPDLVKGNDKIVIEDVFMKFNVMVHSMLSRIGMIVYVLAHQMKINEKYFIWATTARKNIGLKGNVKKDVLHKEFTSKFGIKINDEDITDAIILVLSGIIEKEVVNEDSN